MLSCGARVLPGGARSVHGPCSMPDAPPRTVTSPPGSPGVLCTVSEWTREMGPLLTLPRPAPRLWSPETQSRGSRTWWPCHGGDHQASVRGPCAQADAWGQDVVRGSEAGSWPRVGPRPTARSGSSCLCPRGAGQWVLCLMPGPPVPKEGPSPSAISLKQRPDLYPGSRLHRPVTSAGFSSE